MQLQKHLLREVLGQRPIAEHTQCNAIDAALVCSYQCGERGVLTGTRPDELPVGGARVDLWQRNASRLSPCQSYLASCGRPNRSASVASFCGSIEPTTLTIVNSRRPLATTASPLTRWWVV